MNATISPLKIVNFPARNGEYTLKIIAAENFFTDFDRQVAGTEGNSFTAAATATNGVCITDSINVPFSADENNILSTYSAGIYKGNRLVHSILKDFYINDSLGAVLTFEMIFDMNNLPQQNGGGISFLTLEQAKDLFALKADVIFYDEALIDDDGEILLDG